MIRLFSIFAIALFITLVVMWSNVRAGPKVPTLDQLTGPPTIIEYQEEPHAVFNYGGLQFLYVVTSVPVPFPQCDAVQTIGNELMVVGGDPFGYAFFTKAVPSAFKTDHNPLWDDLVKKSCGQEGCQ